MFRLNSAFSHAVHQLAIEGPASFDLVLGELQRCKSRERQTSLANNTVPVRVAHVGVSGMLPRDRRNSVATCLLACNPAVSVVVIEGESVSARATSLPADSLRRRRRNAQERLHLGVFALPENLLECVGLAPVDRKSVCLPHLQNPARKPASIVIRKPLRSILRALLSPVHVR